MDTLVIIILADALICPSAGEPRRMRATTLRIPKRTPWLCSSLRSALWLRHRHRKGGIAQLVERRPCNWVVVFAGWMLNLLSGNDSSVSRNRWLTFSQKWGRGL
jgi:hypothetical protein